MTKRILAIAVIAMMMSSVFQPKPARALIGLVTGGAGLAVAGAVVGGAGGAMFLAGANGNPQSVDVMGALIAIVGVLFLDSGQNPTASFTPLTTDQAVALGVPSEQAPAAVESFNSEIANANAIMQTITQETLEYNGEFNPTGATPAQLASYADSRWAAYQSELSPQTYDLIARIRHEVGNAVAQAPSAAAR